MAGRILPAEIMVLVGTYLRQARTSRKLSIEQAAQMIGITPQLLSEIENGRELLTDIAAQSILTNYGGARSDRLDALLYEYAMDQLHREAKVKKRKHLSIVGEDPKPWERPRKKLEVSAFVARKKPPIIGLQQRGNINEFKI